MKRDRECPRESDVCDAIASGAWARDDERQADLRRHSDTCGICSDLVRVALALRSDYEAGIRTIEVPPASIVWWRSQLRARREAVRAAARPVTIMHALAAASAMAAFLALGRLFWPVVSQWLARLAIRTGPWIPGTDGAASTGLPLAWIALAACGLVLLVPVALFWLARLRP